MSRYPVERIKYNEIVGEIRVKNIATSLRNLGFGVVINKVQNHDVDVWVYKDDTLVLVIEVTNWRKNVYMDFNRAESIKNNLSKYNDPTRKLLISSFKNNYANRLSHFKGLGIDYLNVEFQTQPEQFYQFYKDKGLANDMRQNDSTTKDIEKRKLKAYLKKRGLI